MTSYKSKKTTMRAGLVVIVLLFFGLTLPLIIQGTTVPMGQLIGLGGFWFLGIMLTVLPLGLRLDVGAEHVKIYLFGLLTRDVCASNVQSVEYATLTAWGLFGLGKGLKGWEKTKTGRKYFSIGENTYGKTAIENVRRVLDSKAAGSVNN
jgi:hypothetical protein